MIEMDVQLDERSTKFLLEQAKQFPREVKRAFLYACGVALKNMRSMMSGKSKRVEKWGDFTRQLRGYQSGRRFGGNLMEDRTALSMKPEGDRVRLGWIGSWVEPYAVKFQEASSVPTAPWWRRSLYERGWFKHGEVPYVAETPARPIVAEIKKDADKHLAEWTLGAFSRVLDGRIKAWIKYSQTSETAAGRRAAARAYRAAHAHADTQELMAKGDR